MSTTRPSRPSRPRQDPRSSTSQVEQLSLLAPTDIPLQFRLDERTRRRGLAQIELIRQQLAQMSAKKTTAATAPTAPAGPALLGTAVRRQAAA